jgi:hypothetical protein
MPTLLKLARPLIVMDFTPVGDVDELFPHPLTAAAIAQTATPRNHIDPKMPPFMAFMIFMVNALRYRLAMSA